MCGEAERAEFHKQLTAAGHGEGERRRAPTAHARVTPPAVGGAVV